ncbi:DUF1800 domain-containing protein [Granulicella cerasi]|uniref:DUF1800 domain-containing protein n=1 Tax=Granulicella cerasi TaxID=741063 RepID=A0ABW1Z7M7_9BACT|nr:DUF1800 domain-containing protein [Granulicella cerasi]
MKADSKVSRGRVSWMRERSRAALCAVMVSSLLVPEAVAADLAAKKPQALSPQQRTLHALNRFTFGPRPGDEQAVASQGLDRWFEQQLHPERIDDSAFEARLEAFPALKLSQADLLVNFPAPLRMKYYLGSNTPLPKFDDPAENAIYADYAARYTFFLHQQASKGKIADPAEAKEMAANDAMMASAPTPAPKARKSELERLAEEPMPSSSMTLMQADAVVALPSQERFDRIVAMAPADNLRFMQIEARQPARITEGFTPRQREVIAAMINPERVVAAEIFEARVLRDVYSQRQLQAVMTDFWLNHFSVYAKKQQAQPYLLNDYERQAILPNALGSFEKMLVATAQSPAMLVYLDNWLSVGPDSLAATRVQRVKARFPNAQLPKRAPSGLNENYARELMELHTVGVNGGYTQKDVIEVAKCFTGWTVTRPYGGRNEGEAPYEFRFDPARHEGGSKVVLGVTIPEGGMQEGLTVLHMLATSPKTAHFVSQKLAVRFVADDPSPALVDRMAATFLKTNGDIAAVMSTMYHSPEFWSPGVYRAKLKTPIEFMVSALRASDAQVENAGVLVQAVDRLGMPLYGMQTPQGYSWKSEDWVSSGALVNRMNFALVLAGDHVRGTAMDWPKVVAMSGKGKQADAMSPTPATEAELELAILGGPAAPHTRSTVLEQFANPTVDQEAQKSFAAETMPPGMRMSPNGEMASDELMQRVVARKPGKNADRGQGLNLQAGPPATPLATMAGLLLGSPDFQRR